MPQLKLSLHLYMECLGSWGGEGKQNNSHVRQRQSRYDQHYRHQDQYGQEDVGIYELCE